MIITNDFVMLNFPKTGSSFSRKVIKQLYSEQCSKTRKLMERLHICNPSVIELMLPKIDEKLNYNRTGQHGTLRQIPLPDRKKPIVSVTRNPIERYKSTYLYRWWEKYPPADIQIIQEKYPHFPNLSFSEYYEMIHLYGKQNRLQNIVPQLELGLHTIQFIQFYFDEPENVLRKMDSTYIEQELFRHDMHPIVFLHQENLKLELRDFLLDTGFNTNQVGFIDGMEKVNVTKNPQDDLKLDFDIQNTIIERDRLIYKIFPEYLPKA